jgi:hypothetical protein
MPATTSTTSVVTPATCLALIDKVRGRVRIVDCRLQIEDWHGRFRIAD